MTTRIVTTVAALAFLVPALCSGQDAPGAPRLESERDELIRLLAQYDATALSTAYSDELRSEGRARAALIQERIEAGDFQAGDQIALLLEGAGAVPWDTLTVEAGPLINLPTLGPIYLQGVLRSELEAHLERELSVFIQTPRVQAHALIRLAFMGVGRPGFYMMPAELPLSEAVMLAGGPAGGVDPGQMQVQRGQEVLWSVEELLAPVAAGRTLDDLGLQAGDRIILREGSAPGAGSGNALTTLAVSTLFATLTTILINSLVR